MGLSLHYNGRFGNPELLPGMIEEVQEIALLNKWSYQICNTNFPTDRFSKNKHDQQLYGISFTPPECETVSLCFLSNGRMSSVALLHFYGDSKDKTKQKYLYMLSVKTQFAGWQTHVMIVHLLKYLSKKYFLELQVKDEGDYWETGNVEILKENFNRYHKLHDHFSTAFDSFPVNEGESMIQYIERMMEYVNRKQKDR